MIDPKLKGNPVTTGKLIYNGLKTCAVIDGNNFCIRSYFTCGKNPKPDVFIRRTFNMLVNLLERHCFDFVIFTFDGGTKWRTELINDNIDNWLGKAAKMGYKGKRTLHTSNDYLQVKKYIKVFRDYILVRFGIPVFIVSDNEADDVMYWISGHLKGVNKVIVSADEDLVQCCSKPNTYWFAPQKKIILSKHSFEHFNEYPLERYLDIKSICGDSSDNIEGVYGLSSKTLWKWYKQSGEYPYNAFVWIGKNGSDKEKEKYLKPVYYHNWRTSYRAMSLEYYSKIWDGLDMNNFYLTLIRDVKITYGDVYRVMKSLRINNIQPSEIKNIEKLLNRCNQNIKSVLEEGTWG